MATSSQPGAKFCSNCGLCLEQSFCFCPKCGNGINKNANGNDSKVVQTTKPSCSTSNTANSRFSLPSYAAFKVKKETDRQSSFSKKSTSTNKKRKIQEKEVTVQVGVMQENLNAKRGETIPLKVTSSATPQAILVAALKKHADFNMRFDDGINYLLAFKDGSKVEVIPGTDPEEPFTLQRYKEVSGFGYSRINLYLLPVNVEAREETVNVNSSEDEMEELPPVTWLGKCASTQNKSSNGICSNSKETLTSESKEDIKDTLNPWSLIETDSEDELVISKQINRDVSLCDDVVSASTLLQQHISSTISFTKSVVLVIRRSKPWKSFVREMTQQNVDDAMDFEVKFTDSMNTVDDKGPRRDFLRLLRNDIVKCSGIFQQTANVGAYVLTHNANKLNSHEYYMAGRAFAVSLIFGGDPPCVLSQSMYNYITIGYDETNPLLNEVPSAQNRGILKKLLEIDNQLVLSNVIQEEAATELMLEAGYQNLSFKLKDVKSIVDNVIKYLVIGKCRNELEDFCEGLAHYKLLELIKLNVSTFRSVFVLGLHKDISADYIIKAFLPQFSEMGTNRREKEEDVYELWMSFVRSTSESDSTVMPKDILRFASGAEEEPVVGWGVNSSPMIMFIESDQPSTTETPSTHESKLPQARTCGPTILLPIANYCDFNEFKEQMITGIISSPEILLH